MHISMLTSLLPEERLMIVDDFGHQCRDAGLNHLFEILEQLLLKKPLTEKNSKTYKKNP